MKLFAIGKFFGENNTKNAYEISNTELAKCTNSIINNNNEIIRRRGGTVIVNGLCHSLYKSNLYDICLCVLNDRLVRINKDLSIVDLNCPIESGELVTYREFQDKIIFSNGITIKYFKDNQVFDFPLVLEEGFDSINNYATQVFDSFNGRLYLAKDDTLYATDLFNISKIDLINGYRRFNSRITMIESVNNGIYLSADKLYFLEGNSFSKMKLNVVSNYPALEGIKLKLDGGQISLPNMKLSGQVVIWASKFGLYVGTDNGQIINLTENRFKFDGLSRVNLSYLSHDNSDYILINHLY